MRVGVGRYNINAYVNVTLALPHAKTVTVFFPDD